MSEGVRFTKIGAWVPWIISAALLGALALVLVRSRGTDTTVFGNLDKQRETVAGMRTSLLESINAEKSALIAEGESESRAFADQARASSQAFSRGRGELEKLVDGGSVPHEKELLGELDSFWREFQEIQNDILNLDIEGTNLKALDLSAIKGLAAVKRFEAVMTDLAKAKVATGDCGQVSRLTSDALVALMKIEYLHSPHIHAVTDAEMGQIEKTMREQDAIVQNALASLGEVVGAAGRGKVDEATQVYVEFAAVTDEVIKLSRANTNVRSLALSMGRERVVAAKCNEILASLQEALKAKGFKATR